MNEKSITRVSQKELTQMKGMTDWKRVKAMTEAEIENNAFLDPDNQPESDEFWDEGVVVLPSNQNITDK